MAKYSTGKTRVSTFTVASLLFIAVNLIFVYCFRRYALDPFGLENRDIGWWTIKNFRQFHEHADLLLIGSSLMCKVINEGEATYLHRQLNGNLHYRCQHLEDLLSQKMKTRIRSLSLSVPGLNVADASVVGCELLKGNARPDVVVYGIAPRDLMDNVLINPADTDIFHLMEKVYNLSSAVAYQGRITREAKFKYVTNQVIDSFLPLYKYQDEITIAFRRATKHLLQAWLPKPSQCPWPPFDGPAQVSLHMLSPDYDQYLPVTPFNPQHPRNQDLRNCYVASFNPFRPPLYCTQLVFLDRFLKTMQERGVKTVLVNMPLRDDCFDLMPPHFYDLYQKDIQRLAYARGAKFIDMQPLAFAEDDFEDQVHLNGRAACKFVELLAPRIADVMPNSQIAEAPGHNLTLSAKASIKAF